MSSRVTGTIELTDRAMPEGFDRWGNAWTVELRYQGRRMTVPFFTGSSHPQPKVADVLECLLMDFTVAREAEDFEHFAADLGLNPDSRRDERTFRALVQQSAALERLLGPDLEPIREAFNDDERVGVRRWVWERENA